MGLVGVLRALRVLRFLEGPPEEDEEGVPLEPVVSEEFGDDEPSGPWGLVGLMSGPEEGVDASGVDRSDSSDKEDEEGEGDSRLPTFSISESLPRF